MFTGIAGASANAGPETASADAHKVANFNRSNIRSHLTMIGQTSLFTGLADVCQKNMTDEGAPANK
jgi:hypothetical protein